MLYSISIFGQLPCPAEWVGAMPYGDTTTPSCENETLPVRMIFDKHHGLGIV